MKSIKVTNTGGPEVLKLEDITLEKPGADEVQIEHVSIGLNYIDTYHRSGLYPLELPTGIGMEAAGIIKEVGSNVSNFSVGDKIAYAAAPLGAYATHRNYTFKIFVKNIKFLCCNCTSLNLNSYWRKMRIKFIFS